MGSERGSGLTVVIKIISDVGSIRVSVGRCLQPIDFRTNSNIL